VKASVIDFKEPGFSGSVWTAVRPNDSRLGTRAPIQPRKLGDLPGPKDAAITKWHLPFTGLKPNHHYTLVVYSPDAGYGIDKPFGRTCFRTNRHPGS